MAEKNVSELEDLLTKAGKVMEGLADTEEGDSKPERRSLHLLYIVSPAGSEEKLCKRRSPKTA